MMIRGIFVALNAIRIDMKLKIKKNSWGYKIQCPNCKAIIRKKRIPDEFVCGICEKRFSVFPIGNSG